jgi:hypothetical protein
MGTKQDQATITISIGGYPHTFKPYTAGKWGCDPCWGCGQYPTVGARVWMDSYGDLYCDPCAQACVYAYLNRPENSPETVPMEVS